MSTVKHFMQIYNEPFKTYLNISETIGGNVLEQSKLVNEIFLWEKEVIKIISSFKQPKHFIHKSKIYETLLKFIQHIKNLHANEESSTHNKLIALISECIEVFLWIQESNPHEYIESYIKKIKEEANNNLEVHQVPVHRDWLKAWTETLESIFAFVEKYFKHGLEWLGVKEYPSSVFFVKSPFLHKSANYALFHEIHKRQATIRLTKQYESEGVLNGLIEKKENSTPFITVPVQHFNDHAHSSCKSKLRLIHKNGNNNNIVMEDGGQKDKLYLYNCKDCNIIVENTISTINIDSCRKLCVLLSNVICGIYIVDCDNIQLFLIEKVPKISLSTSGNVNITMNKFTSSMKMYSSDCSHTQIHFPRHNETFHQYDVPTVLKTKFISENNLKTYVYNKPHALKLL